MTSTRTSEVERSKTFPQTKPKDEQTLGQLVANATQDISLLMKQEVELAKVEIKRDVVAGVKGAAGFGAAGFSGVLALVFLSAAAAFGIGEWLAPWAGFLIVGLTYVVVAALAALFGKHSIAEVGPPEHTIGTVKDDLAFAKHPTKAPGTV
jgi:hypothetical protein